MCTGKLRRGLLGREAPRALLLARVATLAFSVYASTAQAGFTGTDLIIPAVARTSGLYGSEFYSTLWITNQSQSPTSFTASFYQQGRANPTPRTFSDTLAPSETRRYDNVVETLFGMPGAAGAVRVVASDSLLVTSRTYDLPASGREADSNGLFFSGIPSNFAISMGETSQLQGITQGADEDFRYNFGLVNLEVGTVTVHVALKDSLGATLGEKDYNLLAWEALQFNVKDVVPGIATRNALLLTTVTAGTGRVIVYATQLANGSNDSSGFEMSFRNSLLTGSAGVTTLNGLKGDVTLAAGANITLTTLGSTITIAASAPAGPEGPAGPAGPAGPVGIQGAKGATGATGVTGPGGATGATGATGVAGAQGPTGATGMTGRAGGREAAGASGAAVA